jgi:hypothetical protein
MASAHTGDLALVERERPFLAADVERDALVDVCRREHVGTGLHLVDGPVQERVVHRRRCVADVGCLEHLVVSVRKMIAVRVEEIRHKRHLMTNLYRVCFVVASMLGAAREWLR